MSLYHVPEHDPWTKDSDRLFWAIGFAVVAVITMAIAWTLATKTFELLVELVEWIASAF